MNLFAYQNSQRHVATGVTRIDLILTVYERVLRQLERARILLADETAKARDMIRQCELVVSSLALGMGSGAGEVTDTFLRLYEFVGHCLAEGTDQAVGDALDVLKILQQGFEAVRDQTLDLERGGQIPSLDHASMVRVLA